MRYVLTAAFVTLFPDLCFSQAGIAINYKRSDTKHGFYLNATFSYESVDSNSLGQCALKCASRAQCKSLNFHARNNTCQLNAVSLSQVPTGAIEDHDAAYMDKSNIKRNDRCSTISCAESEECVINRDSAVCSKLNQKECPSLLPNPEFTTVSSPCKTTPGSLCSLTCNENYFKSSDSDITGHMICLSSGEWSVSDPKCKVWIHDCSDLKSFGYNTSGVYNISVKGEEKEAYCDMETEGGGWTVVMKRFDGSVDFNQNWNKYKYGFGSASGEYWLGNEYFHILTWRRNYGAYFKLQSWERKWYWAWYAWLYLYSENDGYKIRFGGYKGNAGQTLDLGARSGGSIQFQLFTTHDRDQDQSGGNKASSYGGGWWYKRWAYCVLTGTYGSNNYLWRNIGKLRASTIMVRPRQ